MALTLSSAPALSRSSSPSFQHGLEFSPGPSAKPPLVFIRTTTLWQATHPSRLSRQRRGDIRCINSGVLSWFICLFRGAVCYQAGGLKLTTFLLPSPASRFVANSINTRRGLLESRGATGDSRPSFVPYLTLFAGAGRTPRSEDHHLVALLADSGPSPSILYVSYWILQHRISSCHYDSFPTPNLQCLPVSSPVVTHSRLSLLAVVSWLLMTGWRNRPALLCITNKYSLIAHLPPAFPDLALIRRASLPQARSNTGSSRCLRTAHHGRR